MRVVQNTAERLVLRGVPGSVPWMAFATLVGAAVMAATGWFGWAVVGEGGGYLPLVPLGAGFLMGAALLLIGLVTLAVGRVRLVLDRVTGEGRYEAYSPVVEVGKPCTFRLQDVDSVTIERREEARPASDDHGSFPAQVCRARLRVRHPRRAILLDETENGQEQRVQRVAEAVAAWLDLPTTERG